MGRAEATAAKAARVAKMVLNCILKVCKGEAEELESVVGKCRRVEWSGVDEWIDDEKERRKTPFTFVFIPFDGCQMIAF